MLYNALVVIHFVNLHYKLCYYLLCIWLAILMVCTNMLVDEAILTIQFDINGIYGVIN